MEDGKAIDAPVNSIAEKMTDTSSGTRDNVGIGKGKVLSILDRQIHEVHLFSLIRRAVGHKRSLNTPEIEIKRRYNLCFGRKEDSPVTENLWTEMRKWIKEERYYVRLLGSTYSDAFPNDKIFNKKKQDFIATEIRQSTLPENTMLVGTSHKEKYMNHLGLVGMTHQEAVAFIQRTLGGGTE